MSTENEAKLENENEQETVATEQEGATEKTAEAQEENTEAEAEEPAEEASVEASEEKSSSFDSDLQEAKEKYLRLYSEFENFRRRTSKEKVEMVATASEKVMVDLLPIIDDFARASEAATKEGADAQSVKEGFGLIAQKFSGIVENKGLKAIECKKGDDFDLDKHEAITQFPTDDEALKGKVIDVVEKGYMLGEKVIRFAKVVIGA